MRGNKECRSLNVVKKNDGFCATRQKLYRMWLYYRQKKKIKNLKYKIVEMLQYRYRFIAYMYGEPIRSFKQCQRLIGDFKLLLWTRLVSFVFTLEGY